MNKLNLTIKWIANNFFLTTSAILVVIYFRWFQLNPVDSITSKDEASFTFILGIKFLLFFILVAALIKFMKLQRRSRTFFVIVATISLLINSCHAATYLPEIEDTATFNGTTYYLTYNSHFIDYTFSYPQFTKWHSFFTYKSYGIPTNSHKFLKLIYDQKLDEVSVVENDSDYSLVYTDGIHPRSYEPGDVKLGDHRYYVSSDYLEKTTCKTGKFKCNIVAYTLYECKLDNTSCTLLPFQYIGEGDYVTLESNEEASKINLYLDPTPFNNPKLIYTYGKQPRCYMEGCEILEK